MKYQLKSASFDHFYVERQDVNDPSRNRIVWQWLDPTMTDAPGNPAVNIRTSAGWGIYRANLFRNQRSRDNRKRRRNSGSDCHSYRFKRRTANRHHKRLLPLRIGRNKSNLLVAGIAQRLHFQYANYHAAGRRNRRKHCCERVKFYRFETKF